MLHLKFIQWINKKVVRTLKLRYIVLNYGEIEGKTKNRTLPPFEIQKSPDSSFRPQRDTGQQAFEECSRHGLEKGPLRAKQSEHGVGNTEIAESIPFLGATGPHKYLQSEKTK